jgi:hypothetical protein
MYFMQVYIFCNSAGINVADSSEEVALGKNENVADSSEVSLLQKVVALSLQNKARKMNEEKT